MEELKNNIANVTTIVGTGSVVMGASKILTLVLLITGILFNIIRIIEIKRRKKE